MTKPLRKCRVCGLEAWNEQQLNKFVNHKPSPYGKENICRICKTEYQRQLRKKNGIKPRINKKKWRSTFRKKVIMLYGGVCECCGESNFGFLVMDHIKNNGSKERKKYRTWYNVYKHMRDFFLENPEEARKHYRVLCHNCNSGRQQNGGICPHEEYKAKNEKLFVRFKELITRRKKISEEIHENNDLMVKLIDEIRSIDGKIKKNRSLLKKEAIL